MDEINTQQVSQHRVVDGPHQDLVVDGTFLPRQEHARTGNALEPAGRSDRGVGAIRDDRPGTLHPNRQPFGLQLLEGPVGRGDGDAELLAHLAHRRHCVAWCEDAIDDLTPVVRSDLGISGLAAHNPPLSQFSCRAILVLLYIVALP
jgi:hypothetical protein